MEKDIVIGLKSPEAALTRPAPTGIEGPDTLHNAVRDLITTHHSLNPPAVPILSAEPSPLEFLRFVHRNTPFVVRNGARDWPAHKKWSAAYLADAMRDHRVNVAITPHGNADSVIRLPSVDNNNTTGPDDNQTMLFIKPYETSLPFPSVLSHIATQELQQTPPSPSHSPSPSPILYAQTQNDNLRTEYSPLFADIPPNIPFARIALGNAAPDAVNFWLGNSHSTTALHKDNYENIYVQVLGRKHFVLLPPAAAPCVAERGVLAATYRPRHQLDTEDADATTVAAASWTDLVAQIDTPESYTPFATWDPDAPAVNATPYSAYAQPLRVSLDAGDMLYLPALWYHKVAQSCSDEGICCAVNYWYDMDFSGPFWSMAGFVRGVGLLGVGDDGD
ncbi:cupin-like domain-containing protein, partial [Massariosphaeria phaeospora]